MLIESSQLKIMKKYAAVVDVSPTEQLGDSDTDLKFMALLFGLKSYMYFYLVGRSHPDESIRFPLRKWSSANRSYKRKFIEHAHHLARSENIVFAANVASSSVIRRTGKKYWEFWMGAIPNPSSYNKKNRPRVLMGGYEVNDQVIPPYELLVDDLIVLGWYAESLVSCLSVLIEVNGEAVELDILIDKLPNDQGDSGHYKATLLKEICRRSSNNLLAIKGVPEISDSTQRDLLVDNMAGLLREITLDSTLEYRDAISLFTLNRVQL